MERLDGRDLARILEETGRLEVQRAAEITCRVLDGLQHAHERGIIHRDIKPANVVVAEDGRVKVTDFGIAQALGAVRLTATGAFLGSAHYVAPERVRGEPAVPGSDIYSVGVLLYEMVVGRPPFDGESLMSVLESHLTKDVPPPSRAAPGLSPVLDLVVARATARRLGQRFSSALEMKRHLSSALVPPGRPAMGETHRLRLDGETREDTPPVPYVF
jgi:eukaryotic-like serine/threonine-protein kinase